MNAAIVGKRLPAAAGGAPEADDGPWVVVALDGARNVRRTRAGWLAAWAAEVALIEAGPGTPGQRRAALEALLARNRMAMIEIIARGHALVVLDATGEAAAADGRLSRLAG